MKDPTFEKYWKENARFLPEVTLENEELIKKVAFSVWENLSYDLIQEYDKDIKELNEEIDYMDRENKVYN